MMERREPSEMRKERAGSRGRRATIFFSVKNDRIRMQGAGLATGRRHICAIIVMIIPAIVVRTTDKGRV